VCYRETERGLDRVDNRQAEELRLFFLKIQLLSG
jgi:hypothetical protein